MNRSGAAWSVAAVAAGAAGLATSYLAAMAMSLRLSPLTAVAELVTRLVPGSLVEWAIETNGSSNKTLLVAAVLAVLTVVFALIGRLARRHGTGPALVALLALAAVGGWATLDANGARAGDLLPVVVGFVTWAGALWLLVPRLQRLDAVPPEQRFEEQHSRSRREVLLAVGGVAVVAGAAAVAGRVAGGARRRVEQARRFLRLDVTKPVTPPAARVGVEGVRPWQTSNRDFYLIDTTYAKPTIEPKDWRLRIHGMVENEIELSYADLVDDELTEAWITLNCVSNPVGGPYIGNAWWSGVRLAPILALAKPLPGADAVLQTSEDGWTCGTPLAALTDGRNAMLAMAMNGEPLPIEHGFPVRTIVPGLYGYVSACKWVVDMEVGRFDELSAYWTERGWGEQGPVKMSSRVEVPRDGDAVRAGEVVVAGTAWAQHTGIRAVEVAVDEGPWQPADLAEAPSDDTWVQWRATVEVEPGDHTVRVRATDKDGLVQTGVEVDVLPDGATGWHEVEFSAG